MSNPPRPGPGNLPPLGDYPTPDVGDYPVPVGPSDELPPIDPPPEDPTPPESPPQDPNPVPDSPPEEEPPDEEPPDGGGGGPGPDRQGEIEDALNRMEDAAGRAEEARERAGEARGAAENAAEQSRGGRDAARRAIDAAKDARDAGRSTAKLPVGDLAGPPAKGLWRIGVGEPIDPLTGAWSYEYTDAVVDTASPVLSVRRHYSSRLFRRGAFGLGWDTWLDTSVRLLATGAAYVADGDCAGGFFGAPARAGDPFTPPEGFEGTELRRVGGGWRLSAPDGWRRDLDAAGRLTRE